MNKALITGVNGPGGAFLAQFLLSCGYCVIGTLCDANSGKIHMLSEVGNDEKVSVISMSLNDYRSVLNVLSLTQPNEIYNLVRQSSVNLSFEQPVEILQSISTGPLNLLEAFRF